MDNKNYGKELILDIHDCDTSTFTRKSIEEFCIELCKLIKMQREDLHFWDDEGLPPEEKQTLPHTSGISAVQFILTSNITIHALDILKRVYVNIFSCKDFDTKVAKDFTKKWFKGKIITNHVIDRV